MLKVFYIEAFYRATGLEVRAMELPQDSGGEKTPMSSSSSNSPAAEDMPVSSLFSFNVTNADLNNFRVVCDITFSVAHGRNSYC